MPRADNPITNIQGPDEKGGYTYVCNGCHFYSSGRIATDMKPLQDFANRALSALDSWLDEMAKDPQRIAHRPQ